MLEWHIYFNYNLYNFILFYLVFISVLRDINIQEYFILKSTYCQIFRIMFNHIYSESM